MSQPEKELAFKEVYAANAHRIYRYCYRLTRGNTADAEDLAQETFIQAYKYLDRFEGRSAIHSWLMRIAENEFRRNWNRRSRLDEVGLDDTWEAEITHPDLTDASVDRISVQHALDQLSEPVRQAVILVKSEGLTHREAAEALGVPLGTVQSRVHEGLARVRRILVQQGGWLGTLLVLRLSFELRAWAAQIRAPANLGIRVWRELGLSSQPPAAVGAPAGGSIGLSARLAVIAGLVLLLSAATVLWPRTRSRTATVSPSARMIQALRQVRTMHVTGRDTRYMAGRYGNTIVYPSTLEAWSDGASRLRLRITEVRPAVVKGQRLPEIWTEYQVDAGRTRVLAPQMGPGREITLDAAQQQLTTAFFLPDGEPGRTIWEHPERVTTLREDTGRGELWRVSLESQVKDTIRRWSFLVDPTSYLPVQADLTASVAKPDGLHPLRRTELTHFDYNAPFAEPPKPLNRQ